MKSYKVIVNTKLSQLNVSQKAYLENFLEEFGADFRK